jgi:hypothetical protein
MTPKEKAKELVDKFDNTLTYLESKSKTKQCAIIAVDEILNVISYDVNYQNVYAYFSEVKQEIQAL